MKDTAKKPLSVDGMRQPASLAPRVRPPKPQPQPAVSHAARFTKPARPTVVPKSKKRLPYWLKFSLAVPLVMIVALFVQSAALGQLAIIIYGAAALWWRIPSRTTFSLALIAMIATTVLLVVRGNLPLAQNFATYTFLLLVVGVFTLSRELKKEGGRIYSSRHNRQL